MSTMMWELDLLSGKWHATLVSAYAPTLTNPNDAKVQFYEELKSMIATVPSSDKLIILSDCNAELAQTIHQGKEYWVQMV